MYLHPYELERGRMFVEGAVAAYSVDPRGDSLDARGYSSITPLELAPGSHRIRVQVLPCNAACTSWPQNARLMKRQRRNGRSALEATIIRCEGDIEVKRGSRQDLRPVIVSDRCTFEASHRRTSHATGCFTGHDERTAKAADFEDGTYALVDAATCRVANKGRFVTIAGDRWRGSFDCNSAEGPWRISGHGRVAFERSSSTTKACAANGSDLVRADRVEAGVIRLHDLIGNRDVLMVRTHDASDAPDGFGAVRGAIIEHGDDMRICSSVFASLPPSCGDVGGTAGWVGRTLRVQGLDIGSLDPRSAGDARWVDHAAVVGDVYGNMLTVR